MKFCILGFPRGGTRYMAHLFQSFGYDVRHERMGADGVSAFQWSPAADQFQVYGVPALPLRSDVDCLIHAVRDPVRTIASAVHTLNAATRDYLAQFSADYPGTPDGVARTFLCWHEMIEQHGPDLTVSVESAVDLVAHFIGRNAPQDRPPTDVNSREHPRLRLRDFSEEVRAELAGFRERYGYG